MMPLRTAAAAAAPGVHTSADVDRLHALLDKQPSCVMRVAADGRLLAVNDAALSLLGARALVDVLGTMFTERLHGDGTGWTEFSRRVAQSGSASTECEMSDLAGGRRAIAMQGVVVADHPDGEESLLVAVRDVSTSRRLQASLHEQEDLRRAAQESLQDAVAERDRLRRELDAANAEREQLSAALTQLKNALNTAIDATLLTRQVTGTGPRT
jgi:PAS domain-containing protein